MKQYDVIIVGSGLGGLSAGAILAKAGKKVLVLERHYQFGGFATSFWTHIVLLKQVDCTIFFSFAQIRRNSKDPKLTGPGWSPGPESLHQS